MNILACSIDEIVKIASIVADLTAVVGVIIAVIAIFKNFLTPFTFKAELFLTNARISKNSNTTKKIIADLMIQNKTNKDLYIAEAYLIYNKKEYPPIQRGY